MILNHSVKALIFRADMCLLLQQRDFSHGLTFPGAWTFFGGQVETGEQLKEALIRELLEELGCVPGKIGTEIFSWEWSGTNPAINHCFPVCCEVDEHNLVLKEGHAMAWYSIYELGTLELTPGVNENKSKIIDFFVDLQSSRLKA